MRSNTRLLLTAVMLFQTAAMLLIAFQGEAVNVQALVLAAALPLVTALVAALMELRMRSAIPVIFCGVAVAGIAIIAASLGVIHLWL